MSLYIEITEPNPKRHTHNCRIRVPKNLETPKLGELLRAVEVAAWNTYQVGGRVEVSLMRYSGVLLAVRKIYPLNE